VITNNSRPKFLIVATGIASGTTALPYYRWEKHGITGKGQNRPIFGGFKADQYYYELLGVCYMTASLSSMPEKDVCATCKS
jgi:hypothetical protein